MRKTIQVTSVASTPKQISIQMATGEVYKNGEPKMEKYGIWLNDQDGNPSRAYTQYQKLRPIAGDKFDVEVFEKESSFTNQQGKLINFTQRTINFFYVDGESNPVVSPQATQATVAPQQPKTAPIMPVQEIQQSHANFETIMINLRRDIAGGFKKRDDLIDTLTGRVALLEEQVEKLSKPADTTFKAENMSEQDKSMAEALGIPIIE